jgi:hypothetical protein
MLVRSISSLEDALSEYRGKLEVIMQELVINSLDEKERERIGASEKSDILHVRCQNCGHEFKLTFYLSLHLKRVTKRLIENLGGDKG